MPKLLISAMVVAIAVFSLTAQTPSVQTPARPQTQTAKVQRASWKESAETGFGLSHDDFDAMGLFRLTTEEYGRVLIWDYKRVSDATTKAKADGLAEAKSTQATYTCGRNPQDEASATKINVIVQSGPETPSELTSGLNQRLRRMPDVEIVYDVKETDLTIAIIGYANHLASSSRPIGYVASTLTSSPCVGKFGTNNFNFDAKSNHYLNSGPDLNSVIDQIISDLDAHDFEDARKEHAAMKKLLKPEKP